MNSYFRMYSAALAIVLIAGFGCRKEDYSLVFSHQLHVEENEIECSTCHQPTDGGMSIPGHEVCSNCHEIDEANPSPECLVCHKAKRPSEIEIKKTIQMEAQENDVVFSHKTHTYMDTTCETCHPGAARATSVSEMSLPSLEACMECHNEEIAPLEDCSLCHEASSPVNATHKLNWESEHGIESKFGNSRCMTCHQETICIACHSDTKPLDHNASWRRITHGAQAAWNRTRCMACHQEDFCERCHREAEPLSHKGGWVSGPTRHCFECHFPISSTPCSTCHKEAPHPQAPASPHPPFVGFDCAACHPGGIPGRPPHPNPGVECTICHPRG
jgi:hypothetical protein